MSWFSTTISCFFFFHFVPYCTKFSWAWTKRHNFSEDRNNNLNGAELRHWTKTLESAWYNHSAWKRNLHLICWSGKAWGPGRLGHFQRFQLLFILLSYFPSSCRLMSSLLVFCVPSYGSFLRGSLTTGHNCFFVNEFYHNVTI